MPTKVAGKINTHILCSIPPRLARPENHTIYEKMCRARQATDENVIQRVRFACWMTKPTPPPHTHTHSEYVIHLALAWQQCLRERASMLRHTAVVCLVSNVMNWQC